MLEASFPSRVFRGVRFVLLGFDPVTESQIRFKLVNGGGIDVGKYSKTCTHVIVDNIAYDDPVCVAARNDRKIVVTALWVEHSADIGMHADSTSVLYRPLKDLNGIPGAENLIMCLTGYLRQDRDDITTMVGLMGAEFSKPLVANKVTHLICYKFEGEKYELAKKLGTIKLVNHRWLEDCLKDWVLLPEDNYNMSGFELEMMETEAKDSEEEAEDSKLGQYGETNRNRSLLSSKFGMATTHGLSQLVRESSNAFPHSTDPQVLPKVNDGIGKDSVSIPGNKNKSDQGLTAHDVDDSKISCQAPVVSRHSTSCQLPEKYVKTSDCKNTDFPEAHGFQDLGITGTTNSSDKQPNLHDSTESNKLGSNMRSPSASAEGLAHSTEKHGTVSKSRKNLREYSLPRILDECMGREGNNCETSSSKLEKPSEGIKTTCVEKENDFHKGDEPINLLPQKRRNEASSTKLKSRKVTADAKLSSKGKSLGIKATSLVDEPPKADGYLSVGKDDVKNSNTCLVSKSAASTSISVPFVEPFSGNANSESAQRDDAYHNSPQMAAQGLCASKINGKSDITGFGMGQVFDNDAEQHNISKDFEYSTPGKRKSQNEESTGLANLDLSNEESNKLTRKSPRKKSVAKKSLGVRPKLGSSNKQKKSVSLNKTALQGERVSFSSGSKERATCDAKKHQTSPQTLDVNKSMDLKKVSKYAEDAGGRTDILDDETEAPDDKCEYEIGMEVDEELVHLSKKAEGAAEEKSEANNDVAKCEEAMPPRKGSNEPEKQNSSSVVDSTSKLKVKHQVKKRPGGKTKKTKVGKELSKSEEELSGEKIPNETIHEAEIESREEMSRPADVCENKTIARNKSKNFIEEKENRPIDEDSDIIDGRSVGNTTIESSVRPAKINSEKKEQNPSISESKIRVKTEAACFILSGHRLQRKEFQQVIKRLKGRVCRDSHQWSYQATHFIAPDPLRRTEKFFAAAASGRWILKTDFLTASSQAGKFLPEEPYEWHKNGLSEDGAINMEAPRKWRLLKEKTGHGAFYGMRIVVYGDCIAPPLDTLKRVVKAGDGTILATSPPYTRFLGTGIDYAIVSPGMPRVDMWVQEFLKHEIPCVLADYLVEYVCKPGFSLERHVLYGTHAWAERSYSKLQSKAAEIVEYLIPPKNSNDDGDDIICHVCGSRDRGDVMLICGDESGSVGCGVGTHIDCCDPPLENVPEEDWFCPKCSSTQNCSNKPSKKKKDVLSSSKHK